MWDQQKRQRFKQLRESTVKLSDAEVIELDSQVKELECAEAAYLTGATERIHQERETLEKENRSLEDLTIRRKNLLQRLANFLSEARLGGRG